MNKQGGSVRVERGSTSTSLFLRSLLACSIASVITISLGNVPRGNEASKKNRINRYRFWSIEERIGSIFIYLLNLIRFLIDAL